MNKVLTFLFLSILLATPVLAWDGFDYERGNYIEIEKGNLVRQGNDIEIFDYSTGTYRDVQVESINGRTVEVYDYDTNEYRSFDMD